MKIAKRFVDLVVEREGCVKIVKCRATKLPIGLYKSNEAGMESDPEYPWSTVCETHNNLVCHTSRRLAEMAMSYPDWCEDCQSILNQEDNQ